jgi:hypothetical protein
VADDPVDDADQFLVFGIDLGFARNEVFVPDKGFHLLFPRPAVRGRAVFLQACGARLDALGGMVADAVQTLLADGAADFQDAGAAPDAVAQIVVERQHLVEADPPL